MRNEYELLDSGDGRKLERFGEVVTARPCAQATWPRQYPEAWSTATAVFDRERGWSSPAGADVPESWVVAINDINLRLKPTPAGHLGVFPETRELWGRITQMLASPGASDTSVLNLFAYSGGATLAAARAGCAVCHLDASRSMVNRARENAALNGLDAAPIRWIVEDVGKFLGREYRRGRRYEAIMLDPPSFGHGAKGEQYRIDRDLVPTLEQCAQVLAEKPAFVLLTSHTQGVTAAQLQSVMRDVLGAGDFTSGSMQLTGAPGVRTVESGLWMRWAPA